MRGSLTLDFILSLVLVMASVASFFALSAAQVENTVIASTQHKAEAMAMTIGSSINRFAAIQPAEGSSITLALQGLPESQGVASFGVPGFSVFMGSATTSDCSVMVDSINKKLVIVRISAYRMDSSQPSMVEASYPIVTTSSCDPVRALCGSIIVNCSDTLKVTMESGEVKVGKA